MLFAIGTRVRLKRTGDEGVVKALLDNGMLSVYLLEDDMSIPVAQEDLSRIDDTTIGNITVVKAKVVPAKQVKEPYKPDRPEPASQYAILNPQGVQLAFEPILRNDATPEKYHIFLLNDTADAYLYVFQLHTNGTLAWETRGKLGAASFMDTGYLLFEQLNESAEIDLQCWRILPTGSGPELSRRMKLKPATFFKRLITAPLINRVAHVLKVFETMHPKPKTAKPIADLKTYTQKEQQKAEKPKGWSNLQDLPHEVWQLAVFDNEIDLHIEKLVSNAAKIPHGEILSVQLSHFEQFINKAIRVGAERVFIIHGLGEGKLRDAIARRLRERPEVTDFKNEFHPRYGWGATEVIF